MPNQKEIPNNLPTMRGGAAAVRRSGHANAAGFIQVSKAYIDEMNDLARCAPSAHLVLWTLIKCMNKQNSVLISQDSLCTLTSLSPATIKRSIALLRAQQWMDVLKMGSANIYRVNAEVFWQDRADGRWASFNSRIILNFKEQDKITKLAGKVKTRHIPFVEVADDMHEKKEDFDQTKLNLLDDIDVWPKNDFDPDVE